jgi:putative DNA primase/helicase
MPAMIAMVCDAEGRAVTIHRTYLTMDGKKADIKSPKKLMPPKGTVSGCAVRLFDPENGLLGVAEGIETAVSCQQLFGIPTWAAISTNGIETFIPPKGVRKVVIYADNDPNFAGQKAAYVLANRLYLKDFIVEVLIPDVVGDFNDLLQKK